MSNPGWYSCHIRTSEPLFGCPSVSIEKYFLEFYHRLREIPQPRSIAEVRLDAEQLRGLKNFFRNLPRGSLMWLSDVLPLQLEGCLNVSRSEMLGALVLALGAEVCREESTEGAVWPTVRSCFPEELRSHIFPGGQPCVELKQAIDSAARRLELRHALDWEDSQEYFNTIKLQFGFTRRGARRKLAYWLVGLGQPVSVQTLLGTADSGLESPSFKKLWLTLQNYRRDQLDQEQVRGILIRSPWVKDHWIADLLKQAKAHLERLGSGVATAADLPGEGTDAVGELFLDWNSREPDLSLQLDEDVVESAVADWGASKIRFEVDGKPVCAWLRQGSRWGGERRLPLIAWDASALILSSADGRHVQEFDLAELGLGEDILVFDLKSNGRLLGSREWLDPQREYALVYDDSLALTGVVESDIIDHMQRHGRKLSRLGAGWLGAPRLTLDGLTYSEPLIKNRQRPETMDLTLTNEASDSEGTVRLGESRRLLVQGVPEDASIVELLVARRSVPAAPAKDGWLTTEAVKLDAPLLLGSKRLRVRVQTPARDRCWKPKTSWNVLGLSALEQDEKGKRPARWEIVCPDKVLDRAGGRQVVRVFAPRDQAKTRILAGYRVIASGLRPFSLHLTAGWGEPMTMDAAPTLALSVEDSGVVVRYYGSLLGRSFGSVLLTVPVQPSDRHCVVLLNKTRGRIQQLVPQKTELGDRRWILPDCPDADAWAVAYEGRRLGSGWREPQLAVLIRSRPTVDSFALLRWFKAPVLGPKMRDAFLQAAAQCPVEFLKAWIGEEGLPSGLRHAEVPEELHPVIRAALWGAHIAYPNQAKHVLDLFVARVSAVTMRSDQGARAWAAQRLAQLCPPFASQVLRKVKKGNKLAKVAYRGLLGLSDKLPMSEGEGPLKGLLRRGAHSLGVDEASLDRAAVVLTEGSPAGDDEQMLRRLAESPEGARYLAAVVLRAVAEGNSHSWAPALPRVRTALPSSRM